MIIAAGLPRPPRPSAESGAAAAGHPPRGGGGAVAGAVLHRGADGGGQRPLPRGGGGVRDERPAEEAADARRASHKCLR